MGGEDTGKAAPGQDAIDEASVGTASAPECPICMQVMCQPLLMPCKHAFCRICLLQSTQLAPSGRSCPLCRSLLHVRDLATHPVDLALEKAARAAIPSETYEARVNAAAERLAELQAEADRQLPVFFMHPGSAVGEPVALHLFEPRYKILIRRAWEGRKLFVFCARTPRQGELGVVVRVDHAQFLNNGRANILGQGIKRVVLGDTWVEDNTGGLYYTRVDLTDGAFGGRESPEAFSSAFGSDPPALAVRRAPTCPRCCLM